MITVLLRASAKVKFTLSPFPFVTLQAHSLSLPKSWNMENNFFDDCGMEYNNLHQELAQVRREYLAAESTNIDCMHHSEPNESSVLAAATSSPVSTSDSVGCTPLCNNDDTTLDHDVNSPYEDCTQQIKSFCEHGCDCRYGENQSPCTKSLDVDKVVDHRMQCIELSSPELDLVILGALQSPVSYTHLTLPTKLEV